MELEDIYYIEDYTEFIKACDFLYLLLSQRKASENISHIRMPDYTEHIEYINSRPYAAWYIIKIDGALAGMIYITKDNYIGIGILEHLRHQGIGKKAINALLYSRLDKQPLYANINPANEKSIKLFEGLGFKHIQNTYRLG